MVFELGIAETVCLQRVDHAVNIAKIVVEKRPLHRAGQGVAHVADLFTDGVPDVGDFSGFGVVLDLEDDLRLTWLGITADFVGKRHFLQGFLDLVGHLFGHLLRGRARPVGAHHHGAEGEGRVFVLPELEVGGKAHHHQHDHQVAGQCRVVERPFREVEARLGLNQNGVSRRC